MWFKTGLFAISLTLNVYINDLIVTLSNLAWGIDTGDTNVAALAYATAIVLIDEMEIKCNVLLECPHNSCDSNKMALNIAESNVLHFRDTSV